MLSRVFISIQGIEAILINFELSRQHLNANLIFRWNYLSFTLQFRNLLLNVNLLQDQLLLLFLRFLCRNCSRIGSVVILLLLFPSGMARSSDGCCSRCPIQIVMHEVVIIIIIPSNIFQVIVFIVAVNLEIASRFPLIIIA